MKNPIKMDDLGVYTPIFGNTHVYQTRFILQLLLNPLRSGTIIPMEG